MNPAVLPQRFQAANLGNCMTVQLAERPSSLARTGKGTGGTQLRELDGAVTWAGAEGSSWKPAGYGRTFAACALSVHSTAVGFNEVLDYSQSEPGTAFFP